MLRFLAPALAGGAVMLMTAGCGGSAAPSPTSAPTAAPAAAKPTTATSPSPPAVVSSPAASPAAAIAASPAAAIASPSAAASPAAAAPTIVNLLDTFMYQPATITIPRGATVRWTNTGQTQHTVTNDPSKAANPSDSMLPAGAQPWDSGNIDAAGNYSRTFDTPGQYTYFCIPHEALGMVGHITVTP
jgi:plastocyanin